MDGKKIAIANDEEKTYDPNFWNNPREAEAFMKQLRSKKRWIEDYEKAESLTDDAEVIFEFFKEGFDIIPAVDSK